GETELALNDHLNLDEYRQLMQSRMEELERMARIVDDLLVLARADSQASRLDYEIVDLSDLVIETCEQLRHYAEPGHLHLILENIEPLEIRGDNLRLRQMFRNVLENALKYTPEGGEVRVSLRQESDARCQIIIADTGIGIPASDLSRIFDRFYRVDKARSRECGGSGLGLSIVKWVVEAHAGTISIESKESKGTQVTIILPLWTTERTSSREEIEAPFDVLQMSRRVG